MVVGIGRTGKRLIISGLPVLSMILAGTGYACWTDALNVTTKVTTGGPGMIFADFGLCAQYGNEVTPNGWSIVDGIDDRVYVNDTLFTRAIMDYNKIARGYNIDAYKERQKGYNSAEFSAEFEKPEAIAENVGPYNTIDTKGNHQISITINRMYPGYIQTFRTDVLNVGSIATKLNSLKFDVKGLEDSGKVVDMLGIVLYMDNEQYYPTIDKGKPVFKLVNSFAGEGNYFTVGGVGFIRLSVLKKLSDGGIRKVVMNVTIPRSPVTDNRTDLFLVVATDPDAEGVYTTGSTMVLVKNDDKVSQKKAAKVNIGFLRDQFNVGRDADNPNYLVKRNEFEKR